MNLYQDSTNYICRKYKSRDEWHTNRIQGIGGSDASTLIGRNPWKDNNTLWKEKKGIIVSDDISNKSYVQYGTKAEMYLRELFALDFPEYDVQYEDNVTLQYVSEPWMLYSPDGLLYDPSTGRKGILEIKTTNILQSMQKEKWKDSLPMNYYIQVLHGLIVTGFDFVILKAQLKTVYKNNDIRIETKHYSFTREEKAEDIEWLLSQEKEQWDKYYKGNIEPPTILLL